MRNRSFCYADAAKLLGGGDDATVRALDTAMGGVLLAATAGTSQLAISLFDAKSEVTKLSERLVRALAEKRHGLNRLDQTERIAAAHAVIVVAGFFEAVRGAELPFRTDDLRFDRKTEAGIAGVTRGDQADRPRRLADAVEPPQRRRRGAKVTSLQQLGSSLAKEVVPTLSPATTVDDLRGSLAQLYTTFATRLRVYLEGLAAWDALSESEQFHFREILRREFPERAVSCWEMLFRRLASQFPELQFYVDRADHAATRQLVSTGLAAIKDRLPSTSITPGDVTRTALAKHYRAELTRPIIDSGDVPDYLRIPSLLEGYVDPDFRAVQAIAKDAIHLEEFWERQDVQDDLGGFLVAHLSSVDATRRPLLVLGQPGSGKSVLTKFLAGHLPQADFVVVRVALRQVPADMDIQSQIEHAVRQATGEQISWPTVSRAADGALRVAILDGFDELLQATGVGQSTYLREVATFQEREADQDRPIAVVVTSRVSVADRALLPAVGATAVRLEPFRDGHVDRWLKIWNELNAESLRIRHLQPLPASAALAHREIAEQPLLLLMLALYDAGDNGLQHGPERLSTPDLYERLLARFARREVGKNSRGLLEEEYTERVRDELHRLSVTALAMFNRGRQWVTQTELDRDLSDLLGETTLQREDFKSPTTPAADAIGRFFFVHRSRSIRGEQELLAVEFLHATIGEYLVARLIVDELDTLAAVAELTSSSGLRDRVPATEQLLDMLSFTPVAVRLTVIDSLHSRLQTLPDSRRQVLGGVLLQTFRSVSTGALTSAGKYRPIPQSPAGRQAMQSLNLLLLLLSVRRSVTASELFNQDMDPSLLWRTHATLWYSQCTDDAWTSLIRGLRVTRLGGPSDRDFEISARWDTEWSPPQPDPLWSSTVGAAVLESPFGWTEESFTNQRRTVAILNDRLVRNMFDALRGLEEDSDKEEIHTRALAETFIMTQSGVARSVAGTLIDLWVASSHFHRGEMMLVQAYQNCIDVRWAFSPDDWRNRNRFFRCVLRQMAADIDVLPSALKTTMAEAIAELEDLDEIRIDLDPELAHWLALALADVREPLD
jgi:hypothetical protein